MTMRDYHSPGEESLKMFSRGEENDAARGAIELEAVGLAMLLAGSAMAMVSILGQSNLSQWLRGFVSAGDWRVRAGLRHRLLAGDETALRRRLLGMSRAHVAAALGIPRTAAPAALPGTAAALVTPRGFWHADTWYYSLNSARHTALAIHFERDRAVTVESIASPLH